MHEDFIFATVIDGYHDLSTNGMRLHLLIAVITPAGGTTALAVSRRCHVAAIGVKFSATQVVTVHAGSDTGLSCRDMVNIFL